MSATILPDLVWEPTTACSPRHGHEIELVVAHRWGVRFTTEAAEAASYQGVQTYFKDRVHRASAHVVQPGSADPGNAAQMVAWGQMAWAEAAYNAGAVEVESADAIWLGDDDLGMRELARIFAFLLATGGGLHKPFDGHGLPPVWSTRRGFCRHADLGAAGGGHTACPTTDLALWRRFVGYVQHEHQRGDFRAAWGHR